MDIYEFVKNIGNGMYGQVYLTQHRLEKKQYAVKRINFQDINQRDRENLEMEVRLLQELRHPNIVSYKDSFCDNDNNLNIVMIYCDGGDFYNKIRNAKNKYFTENEIIEWIVQLGLALLYIHDKKILHRDLKTQNIFIKEGKIRIGDFGIAKMFNHTKDLANSVNDSIIQMVGTPLYMSPEQYNSKKYGFKSDIWAFGCCLYEMCNLKHAFEGLVIHLFIQTWNAVALKVLKGVHNPVNSIYSKELRVLIDQMLSVNPKNRPTIATILEKPFIKKKVASYIYDFLQTFKTDLNSDIDQHQVEILKEQANKLGVFNTIMKEISSVDENIYNNNSRYANYLKRKQDEKKRLEEKIMNLEAQKKMIYANYNNKAENNIIKRKNTMPSERKVKTKIDVRKSEYELNNAKRPKSSKRSPQRKGSYDDLQSDYNSNEVKTKAVKKYSFNEDNKEKSRRNSSNKRNSDKKIALIKQQNESIDDNILNTIQEDKNESVAEEKNKILKITQEISQIKENLEKTQNKIEKVEKIMKKEDHPDYDLESDLSEGETVEVSKNNTNDDNGIGKLYEQIKIYSK